MSVEDIASQSSVVFDICMTKDTISVVHVSPGSADIS